MLAVVGEVDVVGEGGVGGLVVKVVADVGEVGALRGDAVYKFDGVGEVGVAGVGLAAEGVEDEDVEALEERKTFGGDVAHVG